MKEQKEESDREVENQRRAGSAYASPEPDEIDTGYVTSVSELLVRQTLTSYMDFRQNLSGLPWGGISMKHVVEAGKSKGQSSQQSSRENSVFGSASRGGSSSGR